MDHDLPMVVSEEDVDSDLVGEAAHDIANLLTIIDALAVHMEEALQGIDDETVEALEAISTIRLAVKRGAVLTRRVLDDARSRAQENEA